MRSAVARAARSISARSTAARSACILQRSTTCLVLIVTTAEQIARERNGGEFRRVLLRIGRTRPLDESVEFVVGQLSEVLLDSQA